MTVFFGTSTATVSSRGRLSLPTRFVGPLAAGAVLAKGHEGCLYLLPAADLSAFGTALLGGASDREARNLARIFFGGATEATPNSRGQIVVPEALRAYADLDATDCAVVGANDRIEIWSARAWSRYEAVAQERFRNDEDAAS
jgi:MraZ protein